LSFQWCQAPEISTIESVEIINVKEGVELCGSVKRDPPLRVWNTNGVKIPLAQQIGIDKSGHKKTSVLCPRSIALVVVALKTLGRLGLLSCLDVIRTRKRHRRQEKTQANE
jgi:hypothetical protein